MIQALRADFRHSRIYFFQGGGNILSWFFRWTLTVLIEIYPKMTFSRFYRTFFSDKSSLLFLPKYSDQIPMVFGLLKNPNKWVYKNVVRNCRMSDTRRAGSRSLLLAGVSPEIITATGGWTSLAFLLYWRQMEEILPPMNTSKAYWQSHIVIHIIDHIKSNTPSHVLSVSEDSNPAIINLL